MPRQVLWTRDQLLVALRLYMRMPFGRLHSKNAEIVSLAEKIGRTPSALAMKACNFASLDPAFRQTNRRGLSSTSTADRAIWTEFEGNAESLAAESEDAFARLDPDQSRRDEQGITPPPGDTDVLRLIRARRVQSFFRAAVLTSYDNRCAVSGLALPELLVSSHIIPWSVSIERRADPTNGICLNALFDRAFDRGLITLDNEYRVIVSRRLSQAVDGAYLACSLDEASGRRVSLPSRFLPAADALEHHRTHVFKR